MEVKHLTKHLLLHLLEFAVIIAAIALSTVMVLNTTRDENQGTGSLLEPPPFSGHLYSIADVERDLEDLGCNIVAFTELYPESTIFYMSNYTDFRRIAYNTHYVLMKTEQTPHEARETMHMFATFDGTLFQHSIQFEVLLTLDEDCLWQHESITVFIRNSGKSDARIEEIYINSEQIEASDWTCTPSIVERDGGTGTIIITYSWDPYETYNFQISPNFGEVLDFQETAPQSDDGEPPEPAFEKLEIAGITWTPNSAFTIVVENTGTKNVTVHHIEVNHVGIASGSVSPATPFTFTTTDAAKTITVTYAYTNGSSYDISVVTSSGYQFTDHFTGGQDIPYTHGQAGVWLDHDAVSWNQGNITIYLRNKGTSDAEIDAVYVGTSYENLEEQTAVTYTPSTTVQKDGGTITITIDYSWASDTRYYFTIAPKLGQPHKFDEKAPQ